MNMHYLILKRKLGFLLILIILFTSCNRQENDAQPETNGYNIQKVEKWYNSNLNLLRKESENKLDFNYLNLTPDWENANIENEFLDKLFYVSVPVKDKNLPVFYCDIVNDRKETVRIKLPKPIFIFYKDNLGALKFRVLKLIPDRIAHGGFNGAVIIFNQDGSTYAIDKYISGKKVNDSSVKKDSGKRNSNKRTTDYYICNTYHTYYLSIGCGIDDLVVYGAVVHTVNNEPVSFPSIPNAYGGCNGDWNIVGHTSTESCYHSETPPPGDGDGGDGGNGGENPDNTWVFVTGPNLGKLCNGEDYNFQRIGTAYVGSISKLGFQMENLQTRELLIVNIYESCITMPYLGRGFNPSQKFIEAYNAAVVSTTDDVKSGLVDPANHSVRNHLINKINSNLQSGGGAFNPRSTTFIASNCLGNITPVQAIYCGDN